MTQGMSESESFLLDYLISRPQPYLYPVRNLVQSFHSLKPLALYYKAFWRYPAFAAGIAGPLGYDPERLVLIQAATGSASDVPPGFGDQAQTQLEITAEQAQQQLGTDRFGTLASTKFTWSGFPRLRAVY